MEPFADLSEEMPCVVRTVPYCCFVKAVGAIVGNCGADIWDRPPAYHGLKGRDTIHTISGKRVSPARRAKGSGFDWDSADSLVGCGRGADGQ